MNGHNASNFPPRPGFSLVKGSAVGAPPFPPRPPGLLAEMIPVSFLLNNSSPPARASLSIGWHAPESLRKPQEPDIDQPYRNATRATWGDGDCPGAIRAYGKLLIEAKLGELLKPESPAERGAKGGRGKKATAPTVGAFSVPTVSTYRKVAKSKDRLGELLPAMSREETGKAGGRGKKKKGSFTG